MNLIQRKWLALGRWLRAARIRRLEATIHHEREQIDKYLAGRVKALERLKREFDDRTSEQIRHKVEMAAKFWW